MGSRETGLTTILIVLIGVGILSLASGGYRGPWTDVVPAPREFGAARETAQNPTRSLPNDAFAVQWGFSPIPKTWKAGSIQTISVTFRNASDVIWPDPRSADPSASGAYAVRVTFHWVERGANSGPEGHNPRADLLEPLPPGASTTLPIAVRAPTTPGAYDLEFDLVQELIAWFRDKGAQSLKIPVKVAE